MNHVDHSSSVSGHHKESGSLEPGRGQSLQFSCHAAVTCQVSRDPGLGGVHILRPVPGPENILESIISYKYVEES